MSSRNHKKRLRVVFVSHDAYRAGAQLYLLHAVRWLVEREFVDATIVLLGGGELEADFRTLGRTIVVEPKLSWSQRVSRRLAKILPNGSLSIQPRVLEDIGRLLIADPPDLIYANTLVSGVAIGKFGRVPCPILVHVHELESWIDQKLGTAAMQRLDRCAPHYAVVSGSVGAVMQNRLNVAPSRISILPGFVPSMPSLDELADRHFEAREMLGIPHDAYVVGGCGTQDLRKGMDIFLATAEYFVHTGRDPRIRFLWLGGGREQEFGYWSRVDLGKSGAAERMIVLDAQADPRPFFAAIDALFVSSREDPFPLIGLEAASWGRPIIAMAGAGGMEDFVGTDAGIVVPYKSTPAIVEAIERLASVPGLGLALGQTGRLRVSNQYHIDRRMEHSLALLHTVAGFASDDPANPVH